MWRSGVAIVSPSFSYGVTGNVQLSVSAPFHLNHGEHPVGRFSALMPGDPEAEVLAAWRFHHSLTGIGTRNESFWESTGERVDSGWRSAEAPAGVGHHDTPTPSSAPASSGIIVLPNSGGRGVYTGPTFLLTFRNVALQSGVLFAVWSDPNGIQPAEKFRAVVGMSYFLLRGRR